MPRALLTIEADASSFRSALQEARGLAKTATQTLNADARRAAREREKLEAEEVATARRQLRAMTQARQKAARDRARVEEAAVKAAKKAQDTSVKDAAKAEARRTADARRESKARAVLAAREAKDIERAEAEKVKAAEQAEKRRTRLAEQEAKKRVRAEQRAEREARAERRGVGRTVTSGLNQVGGAAAGYARTVHGEFQTARERRAYADRELGTAIRNSGGNADDTTTARADITTFANDTGMAYDDVVSALRLGQDRGSVLEPRDGQTRSDALHDALRTVREANAEGVDPGQFLTARGRLAQTGLSGDALNTAMRFTMRAAQRGSVEVDQIIQQGLPGASSLMTQRAAALGPGATDQQRQAARLQAFQESVALQEVAASTGRQPGNSANTLAGLNNFLRTPRRQEMILNNLRTAQSQVNTSTPEGRARAAQLRGLYEGDNALFENDPTRRGHAMRLKASVSPLDLSARLAQATGGDANAAANILAGGGRGNPQSLLTNMRSLMSFLGSEGGRVTSLMNGGGVSNAELGSHQNAVEHDALSELNRNQNAHDNELANNTGMLKQLSDRFADWSARNPLLAPLAGVAAPIAGSALSKGAGALAARVGGGALGRAMPFAGAAVTAYNAVSDMRSGRGVGQTITNALADMLPGGAALHGFSAPSAADAARRVDLSDATINRLAGALRSAPLTVSGHDAAQIAGAANGSRSVPSP